MRRRVQKKTIERGERKGSLKKIIENVILLMLHHVLDRNPSSGEQLLAAINQ